MCVRRTSVHTHTHRSIFESSSVCGSVSARVCMNFSGWHGADSQMEKFAACEHVSGQIKKKKGLIKKKGRAGFMKASNTHSATFYGLGIESWDPSRVLQLSVARTGPSPPSTGTLLSSGPRSVAARSECEQTNQNLRSVPWELDGNSPRQLPGGGDTLRIHQFSCFATIFRVIPAHGATLEWRRDKQEVIKKQKMK